MPNSTESRDRVTCTQSINFIMNVQPYSHLRYTIHLQIVYECCLCTIHLQILYECCKITSKLSLYCLALLEIVIIESWCFAAMFLVMNCYVCQCLTFCSYRKDTLSPYFTGDVLKVAKKCWEQIHGSIGEAIEVSYALGLFHCCYSIIMLTVQVPENLWRVWSSGEAIKSWSVETWTQRLSTSLVSWHYLMLG